MTYYKLFAPDGTIVGVVSLKAAKAKWVLVKMNGGYKTYGYQYGEYVLRFMGRDYTPNAAEIVDHVL